MLKDLCRVPINDFMNLCLSLFGKNVAVCSWVVQVCHNFYSNFIVNHTSIVDNLYIIPSVTIILSVPPPLT